MTVDSTYTIGTLTLRNFNGDINRLTGNGKLIFDNGSADSFVNFGRTNTRYSTLRPDLDVDVQLNSNLDVRMGSARNEESSVGRIGRVISGTGKLTLTLGYIVSDATLTRLYKLGSSGANTYSGGTEVRSVLPTAYGANTSGMSPNSLFLNALSSGAFGSGDVLLNSASLNTSPVTVLTTGSGGLQLKLSANNVMGSSAKLTQGGDGAGLVLLESTTQSLAGLETLGTSTEQGRKRISSSTGASLTLNTRAGQSYTYGGIIVGPTSMRVSGSGKQVFTNVNAYSGATTVESGTLAIASGGAINSTSGVTVNGSTAEFNYNSSTTLSQPLTLTQGILSGTGTIGTAVSVGSGAVLSPGNSPGTQAFTAGLTWLSGGTYDWEINDATGTLGGNPGWDLLDVTGGTLSLASLTPGSFTLDLITLSNLVSGSMANYTPGQQYTWQIVRTAAGGVMTPSGTAVGGEDLTSLFNLVTASWASGPVPSTIQVKVSSGGTGLDLVVVPEPETLVLAGVGVFMAGWSLWKRRRIAAICDPDARA